MRKLLIQGMAGFVLLVLLTVGCSGPNKTVDKSDLPSYCTFASNTKNEAELNYCKLPNGDTCYIVESGNGIAISCNFIVAPIP